MSGIVGILHLDRGPVDVQLLRKLTQSLVFRGPDAKTIWIDDRDGGHVGFGHTLLKTTHEAEREHQPFSLDGNTWIVADARVDGRSNLKAKLQTYVGHTELKDASDAELILRAYDVWDESCLEHLLGDFVFAIWDGRRQRLFCARDHMGVKPLYYAHIGGHFIFSNTLDCIREHPDVSDRLNDLAILDFLLFDMNMEPGTTSFADIKRLPPAHILKCEQENISTRLYWTLPIATPILFKRPGECVERFRELLDSAVTDRLRTNSIGVLMSGGLDSTTVAASAKRVLSRDGAHGSLLAFTQVFDSLIPDEERHYAGLAAKALKIPVEFQASDAFPLFHGADKPEYRDPEPTHLPWSGSDMEQLRQLAAKSRVALTGFGADPMLSSRISVHFRQRLRKHEFSQALYDAARFLSAEKRMSRLYVRTRLRLLFAPKNDNSQYPPWLNEDFEKRMGVRDRWQNLSHVPISPVAVRPEAYEALAGPSWDNLFEAYDPGVTGIPVEVRHPFFDLRLMSFLLTLAALPWCSDKELLREAGRGVLPDAVRLRRKSPLLAEPLISLLQRPESAWLDRYEPVPMLERYVVQKRIPPVFREKELSTAWMHLRPFSLNHWLLRYCGKRGLVRNISLPYNLV
jgi:asparagine synthase (glutamine-hydrolysing)